MRNLRIFAVAAMGLGMLGRAAPLVSTTLDVTISTTTATADDYLLFYSNGVAAYYSLGALPSTSALPGGVLSASYTVPGNFTSGYVTAIGLATESDVVVALGSGISSTAIASGWSGIFLAAESTIATDLATANTTALTTFLTTEYANNSADFIAYSGTPGTGNVAEFSNSIIGSLTVSSAPEPSTAALLGLGLGVSVLASRRKAAGIGPRRSGPDQSCGDQA